MNIADKLIYLLRAMEATQNAAELDGELKARTNIGLDIYRLNNIIGELANGDNTAHEKCTLLVVSGSALECYNCGKKMKPEDMYCGKC